MTVTNPDWLVAVHKGDTLRISTTYDSDRASWYESMGIMVVWMADHDAGGTDPFVTPVDQPGHLTHGHLPENDHHGGQDATLPDITALPTQAASAPIHIANFFYGSGDMRTGGTLPSVKQGQPLTFINDDSPVGPGIWHSITACKAPCNLETGIAYPSRTRTSRSTRASSARRACRPRVASTGRRRPASPLAPTPTSAGSTRRCAVASS